MKKVLLLSMSLMIIGLMTSCSSGGSKGNSKKMETASYSYAGFTVSFTHPEGFFTRSEDANDFVFSKKDGVAYVGKDFTMQVAISSLVYSSFQEMKETLISQQFAPVDIKGSSIEGFGFSRYGQPAYTCFFPVGDKMQVALRFFPNEHKHPTVEEQNNRENAAKFKKAADALFQSDEVQNIIRSVKVTKN